MASIQKINPHLWFEKEAQQAADFYVSVFKDSQVIKTSYYGKAGFDVHKMPEGTVMTVEFDIAGQRFMALNGGPHFKFNESISFIVNCKNQDEIDFYWEKLGAGGDPKAQQCGWLKDKFGLSWQIVPEVMGDMMESRDEKTERMFTAMMDMKKLDIQKLKDAYDGRQTS